MPSLFPDDRPAAGRPFRKFAGKPRPKVEDRDLPPLKPGWVLAHCDGGSRGNPGPAGFGAELCNDQGEQIAELSEFLGIRTNNYAEYSGLLAVLDYALAQGIARLRVVADSELMVKQVQGKYRVNSPDLKPLHEEARRRTAKLEGFEILHALRHKNQTADRLANEAMDRGMGRDRPAPAAPPPVRAVPYPTPAAAPPRPDSFGGTQITARVAGGSSRPTPVSNPNGPTAAHAQPIRGFVRDGVVHPLGGASLPEGAFVKIMPE